MIRDIGDEQAGLIRVERKSIRLLQPGKGRGAAIAVAGAAAIARER